MTVENHYVSRNEMTSMQKTKIAELRKRAASDLMKYPDYDTDFSLLRWLMGWDYDIDGGYGDVMVRTCIAVLTNRGRRYEMILPKIAEAINVLVALGLNQMEVENVAELNTRIRSMSNVSGYFPGGLMCQDDEGNIVYMQALGRTHPKSLIRSGCFSELFRLSIVEAELAFKLVRRAEQAIDRKLGTKIIVDLDQFSMDVLYAPALSAYLSLLTILQKLFPDFARHIYLINCPLMIKTVYAIVQPVLSKQTRDKVTFLGNGWKDFLVNELGAHNIYKHWGGTKASQSPTGDIRMGGRVPEKLQYKPEEHVDDNKEGFEKVTVSARAKAEVKVSGTKGRTFRWIWRVEGGDIDFGVQKDGKMVFPTFRSSTEFHPEIGRLECKETDYYSFFFDNSYGKVWSKEISYKIWLE